MLNHIKKNVLFCLFLGVFLYLLGFFIFTKQHEFCPSYHPSKESIPEFNLPKNQIKINFASNGFFVKNPPFQDFISLAYGSDSVLDSLNKCGIPKETLVVMRDNQYSNVNLQWLDKYCSWWIGVLDLYQLSYERETFDCDNFSDLFVTVYNFSSHNRSNRTAAQVAVATVVVEQIKNFADISYGSDSWHSLNLVWTSSGWFIVEPQNGTYISLESYPNKNTIKAIIF